MAGSVALLSGRERVYGGYCVMREVGGLFLW